MVEEVPVGILPRSCHGVALAPVSSVGGYSERVLRIEIDGRTPDSDLLAAALLNQYGHFTAMQVRSHRVRGFDLHLARLTAATAELFGVDLDTDADDGTVSETSIANIAFFDGAAITWPDAPALDGITKQLLQRHGPGAGLPSRTARVTLDDVTTYRAAFVTNLQGVAPVSAIDGTPLAVDDDLMTTLYQVYESVAWDVI